MSDSCARFLEWCAPLLTPAELDQTRRAVADFLADPVTARVQGELAAYEARDDVHSWLDEFWRDRYLGRRDRIALNANFFFLFNDVPPGGEGGGTAGDASGAQIGRATALITAAVAHKRALDSQTFPPSTRRGQPLSMQQHRYLFSTTRIPGERRDSVRAPYADAHRRPSDARHIIVLARGALYAVDVIAPDGEPHAPHEIATALREVVAAT
ncbi:MAG: choline/carnitine O-acyltransferase, partial [Nocardiopsaceae bacterium]|nr:choline/carnitine O-acyltransferase [Nocardiopsaceae bacterium]